MLPASCLANNRAPIAARLKFYLIYLLLLKWNVTTGVIMGVDHSSCVYNGCGRIKRWET